MCSYFSIEDGRIKTFLAYSFFFNKCKNATVQKERFSVFREGAVLCAGGLSLNVAPQLSRKIKADSGKFETFIESNQQYTRWEIVNIQKFPNQVFKLIYVAWLF